MQMDTRDNKERYDQTIKAYKERAEMKDKRLEEYQIQFNAYKTASVQLRQKYETE